MIEFARYIALGDSVSIDLYPALDAGEVDVAVALERDPSVGRVAPLGAASLLYHNADDRWPEFAGDDLVSRFPGIDFRNLAADGATIGDVFGEQMSQLDETDEPTLVTLTVGGNDLLSAYGSRARRSLLDKIESDIADAYDFLLDTLRARLPGGTFVIATVYDPSDRSGVIPGVYDAGPLPLDILDRFNAARPHARHRNAAHTSRRRPRPFPWPRRWRGRVGSMVLAPLADRAERARCEPGQERLARGAAGRDDRVALAVQHLIEAVTNGETASCRSRSVRARG